MTDASGFDFLDVDRLRLRPGLKWSRAEPDVIAAWVADMDFAVAPAITAALREVVESADLGYPSWIDDPSPLEPVFAARMATRFGWQPLRGRVREFSDLIHAFEVMLELLTGPGDGIAIHTPTYRPFAEAIAAGGRRLVPIPWSRTDAGWRFDADDLDRRVAEAGCRVLVVINPHNPTGRVLAHDELRALAEVAERHDLTVISDEIHSDLVYDGSVHVPFASLGAGAAARTVTLTSATKAFNIAGVRCGLAHVGPDRLWSTLTSYPEHVYGGTNVFGVAATRAAWQDGGSWLDALMARLRANRSLVADALAAGAPDVGFARPEATYFAWLDLRETSLGANPATAVLERSRVMLTPGEQTGPGGEGFARLNFATAPNVLEEILARLVAVL